MTELTLPAILDIPDKMLPMIERFNDYRVLLAEGGRGGSKSHSIGRFLLFLGDRTSLRIVCGRETQNSINESVHALLSDIIKQYALNYEIQANRITHKTNGTTFVFRGFREQGRFNTQGLEGIDCLWIDEGQAITKASMDVILPTIRKPKSRIFVSMNRHMENDPAYELLVDRPDSLHISINYKDNKYCTDELKKEAEACKLKSEKDFLHIWMGEPLLQLEDNVFTYKELKGTQPNPHALREGYGFRVGGFDVARYGDDKCAAVIVQQMGALHWEMIYQDQWDHKDLNYTSGRILTTANTQHIDRSVIDEDGIGGGPLDTIRHGRGLEQFVGFKNLPMGMDKDKQYGNVRTAAVYKLKKLVEDGHIRITDEETIRELCTLKYKYDNYQRKILIGKDQMRKQFDIKSPNLADALVMAISQIGEINYQQQEMYQTKQPQYAKEDSLFSLGGIR